jgi:hypothetical protein
MRTEARAPFLSVFSAILEGFDHAFAGFVFFEDESFEDGVGEAPAGVLGPEAVREVEGDAAIGFVGGSDGFSPAPVVVLGHETGDALVADAGPIESLSADFGVVIGLVGVGGSEDFDGLVVLVGAHVVLAGAESGETGEWVFREALLEFGEDHRGVEELGVGKLIEAQHLGFRGLVGFFSERLCLLFGGEAGLLEVTDEP